MGVDGKFTTHKFWKHQAVCCEFIEIINVFKDDGIRADVAVYVYEQYDMGYALLTPTRMMINKKKYGQWNQYTPRGQVVG